MRRSVVLVALMTGGAIALAGCGIADSRSPVPEFMRSKADDPPPIEPPPDVDQLVRQRLDSYSRPRPIRKKCGSRRRAMIFSRTWLDRMRQGRARTTRWASHWVRRRIESRSTAASSPTGGALKPRIPAPPKPTIRSESSRPSRPLPTPRGQAPSQQPSWPPGVHRRVRDLRSRARSPCPRYKAR